MSGRRSGMMDGKDSDFLGLARRRYSVRSYSERPVERGKVDLILEAGRVAPTAVNYQPQMVYVLRSPEALGKIRRITRSTYGAPLVFLVCSDSERSWHSCFEEGYDSGEMDASIVCTHMMLEAEDLGLGSVWVLMFDPREVSEAFGLPDNIRPHCLLAVGYPSEDAGPYRPWHDSFRPLSDTVREL